MKAQFIIITLLFGLLTINGYSSNTDPKKQEEKKSTKVEYDFNLFKFFSVSAVATPVDSLKAIKPAVINRKRKEDLH
jgi:hypothetical protein